MYPKTFLNTHLKAQPTITKTARALSTRSKSSYLNHLSQHYQPPPSRTRAFLKIGRNCLPHENHKGSKQKKLF